MAADATIKSDIDESPDVAFDEGRARRRSLVLSCVAIAISVLACLFTGLQAVSEWRQATTAVEELNRNIDVQNKASQDADVRQWQQTMAYSIIDNGTATDATKKTPGLTFEEIRERYIKEAQVSDAVEIGKTELQPLALRRILVDLIMLGLNAAKLVLTPSQAAG